MSETGRNMIGAIAAAIVVNMTFYYLIFDDPAAIKTIIVGIFFIGIPLFVFAYQLILLSAQTERSHMHFAFWTVYATTTIVMFIIIMSSYIVLV